MRTGEPCTPPVRGFGSVISLRGFGLHLREWAEADLPVMVELFDETEVARWTPLRRPFDHAAARAYLDKARARRAEGRGIQLAITADGQRAALGEILLFRTGPGGREPHGDDAELGYAIGAAHRGRGLATRAVRLMTTYAHELGMRNVLLRIDPANTASVAVARKTGFQLTDLPPGTSSGNGLLHTWRHQPREGPDRQPH